MSRINSSLHRSLLCCLLIIPACNDSTGDDGDPLACPQTYEFGNYGCARVAGRVLGSTGEPLSGVIVIPRPSDDPERGSYNQASGTSNDEGNYLVQITRYGEPAAVPTPDTLTIYLVASQLRGSEVTSDSVLVMLTFAPVGEVPPTATQDLQLPSP